MPDGEGFSHGFLRFAGSAGPPLEVQREAAKLPLEAISSRYASLVGLLNALFLLARSTLVGLVLWFQNGGGCLYCPLFSALFASNVFDGLKSSSWSRFV